MLYCNLNVTLYPKHHIDPQIYTIPVSIEILWSRAGEMDVCVNCLLCEHEDHRCTQAWVWMCASMIPARWGSCKYRWLWATRPGYWEQNSSPLQQQQALLTAGTSFQWPSPPLPLNASDISVSPSPVLPQMLEAQGWLFCPTQKGCWRHMAGMPHSEACSLLGRHG